MPKHAIRLEGKFNRQTDRHTSRELPLHLTPLYVKRADLRAEELPDVADAAELEKWRWWLDSEELYDEQRDMPLITKVGGISLNIFWLPLLEYMAGECDPVQIITVFCQCHKWGVYPPPWVMNQIYNRFAEYLNNNMNGTKPSRLGEYFGEKPGGKRSPYFKNLVMDDFMERNCIDVAKLRVWFKKTKEDSIGIVALRMETAPNKTSFKREKGEASLEKAYKKWDRSEKEKYRNCFRNKKPTIEYKIEFLQTFPPEAFTGHPDLEKILGTTP